MPSSDASILAAAIDPRSDIATLGIPLTGTELVALQASGTALDRSSPIRFWVNVGAPQRFGGFWTDPPGSGRLVVGILDGDPSALLLARCLDVGVDVRYVAARMSGVDDNVLADRVKADMAALRSGGTKIQSVGIGVRDSVMVVVVGVTGVTDAIRAQLTARYGESIVVEEQAPISPA